MRTSAGGIPAAFCFLLQPDIIPLTPRHFLFPTFHDEQCNSDTAMATSRPDLSLPDRVPEMERYHEANLLPFALYTLCDLNERDLTQLCMVCQSKCQLNEGQAQVLPPPQSHFVGQPLRAIVDYHVGLARNGRFDPRYIIVAAYRDWESHGVLVVTLNDDDFVCRPDSLWSKAEESGLTLVNLQILNTDWYEAKETLALHAH